MDRTSQMKYKIFSRPTGALYEGLCRNGNTNWCVEKFRHSLWINVYTFVQKPEAFFVFVSLRPSECGDSRLHPHPTLSSNLLVSFFCFLPFSLLHILEFSPLGGHIKTTIFLLLSPFFIFWNFYSKVALKQQSNWVQTTIRTRRVLA